MANLKSAMKRLRQNEKRRLRNRHVRGVARSHIKGARAAVEMKDLEAARTETNLAIKALDKAAQKSVVHKNNAARRKSRLLASLHNLEKQVSE